MSGSLLRDAITLAYQAGREICPLDVCLQRLESREPRASDAFEFRSRGHVNREGYTLRVSIF
jgi:hypothetical protein